jgi:hypothetical protein
MFHIIVVAFVCRAEAWRPLRTPAHARGSPHKDTMMTNWFRNLKQHTPEQSELRDPGNRWTPVGGREQIARRLNEALSSWCIEAGKAEQSSDFPKPDAARASEPGEDIHRPDVEEQAERSALNEDCPRPEERAHARPGADSSANRKSEADSGSSQQEPVAPYTEVATDYYESRRVGLICSEQRGGQRWRAQAGPRNTCRLTRRSADGEIVRIHIGRQQAGPKVAAILTVVESCRRMKLAVGELLGGGSARTRWTFPSTRRLSRPRLGSPQFRTNLSTRVPRTLTLIVPGLDTLSIGPLDLRI